MVLKIAVAALSLILPFVLVVAPGGAAASPLPVETTRSVVYVIQNHDQHVTLRDSADKAVLTCRAATPTLQFIITLPASLFQHLDATADLLNTKHAAYQVPLTLEDQNGLRLWSSLVSVPSWMHTMSFYARSSSAKVGTQLEFTFSSKMPDTADGSDDSVPPPLIVGIGSDGRFTGMKVADKVFTVAPTPNGFSMAGPDGFHLSESADKDGGAMLDMNGTQVPIEKVTRDSKSYLSFPWNGHKVFIGGTSQFHINNDGDLIVDAAGPAK